MAALRLFLSYASEDAVEAHRLYDNFSLDSEVEVWFDRDALRGGDNWKRAIRQADVFVLLLSRSSTSKKGYIQREIREALEVLQTLPEGGIFIVPMRLEPCEPHFSVLEDLHYLDLFPDWDAGVGRLQELLIGHFGAPRHSAATVRIHAEIHDILSEVDLGPYTYRPNFIVTEYGDWNLTSAEVTGLLSSPEVEPHYLLRVAVANDGGSDLAHKALDLRMAVDMHKVTMRKEVEGVFIQVIPEEDCASNPLDYLADNLIYTSILDGRGRGWVERERDLKTLGFLTFLYA